MKNEIITGVLALFSVPFIKLLLSFFDNRSKGIKNYRSTLDLVEKESSNYSFYKEFSSSYFFESDFFMKTGIKTNFESIEKYYKFKKELGRNYTWDHVKLVNVHLNFDEENFKIDLNKVDKFYSLFVSVMASCLFLVSVFGLIYIGNIKGDDIWYMRILGMFMVFFIPAILGGVLFNSITSIQIAKRMEKHLAKSKK